MLLMPLAENSNPPPSSGNRRERGSCRSSSSSLYLGSRWAPHWWGSGAKENYDWRVSVMYYSVLLNDSYFVGDE